MHPVTIVVHHDEGPERYINVFCEHETERRGRRTRRMFSGGVLTVLLGARPLARVLLLVV